MNKKVVLMFLAGYLLAFALPPQRLLGFMRGA